MGTDRTRGAGLWDRYRFQTSGSTSWRTCTPVAWARDGSEVRHRSRPASGTDPKERSLEGRRQDSTSPAHRVEATGRLTSEDLQSARIAPTRQLRSR